MRLVKQKGLKVPNYKLVIFREPINIFEKFSYIVKHLKGFIRVWEKNI